MDILNITDETKQELLNYCEQSLIDYVFDDFKRIGKIIERTAGMPSKWWTIDDYVSDKSIEDRCKYAVILSLAAIGGFIQINGIQYVGDVKVLSILKELHIISEDDFDWFVETFFEISDGKSLKFSLKEGHCVIK